MDENIRQTIDELYALRAGLSLASLEYDKAESVKNEFMLDFDKLEGKRQQKIKLKNGKTTEKQEIEGRYKKDNASAMAHNSGKMAKIEAKRAELEQAKMRLESVERDYKSKKLKNFLLTLWIVTSVLLAILAFIAPYIGDPEESVLAVVFLEVGVFGGLCPLIPACIITYVRRKRNSRYNSPNPFQERRYLEQAQKNLRDAESVPFMVVYANAEVENQIQSDTRYKLLSNEEQNIDNDLIEIARVKNDIHKKAQGEMKAYSKKGEAIYEALIPVFNRLLDERDWKNVDLIIYLLETGRAENMKEALQQVDVYRHTEKITRAITEANIAISSSINRGIGRLEGAIKTCALEINARLEEIKINQTYLENQLIESNEGLSKVFDSTRIQNALLEKANTTSEQMARSIEKMKEYADEAYELKHREWYYRT